MTRYAIVRIGRRFYVSPDSKVGYRNLVCFYLGHLEAAKKLAKNMEEELRSLPKYRANGVKVGAKPPHSTPCVIDRDDVA